MSENYLQDAPWHVWGKEASLLGTSHTRHPGRSKLAASWPIICSGKAETKAFWGRKRTKIADHKKWHTEPSLSIEAAN